MCEKHSFLVDEDGKIYHGFGIIESHSTIAMIHNINEDKCNKYEYNPNKKSDKAYGISGLKLDSEVFNASNYICDCIEKYIKNNFKNLKEWKTYSKFSFTLPDNLSVGGSLYLSGTAINNIPTKFKNKIINSN